ncbi:hypothetical protein XspCFBP7912_01450 [Xanthomonas sp. CFBP 7912]|nr:hypothetical protein XspCFBP7912_01450 [Xanthomonas sp. CFBP 7912]
MTSNACCWPASIPWHRASAAGCWICCWPRARRGGGAEFRESGIGNRESGVGSRESGVGSRESESGVRSPESGVGGSVVVALLVVPGSGCGSRDRCSSDCARRHLHRGVARADASRFAGRCARG